MALKHMLNLKQVSEHILQNNTKFRPGAPKELVTKITDYLSESLSAPYETALDMGCGSGRSTTGIAPYFKDVIGFDSREDSLNYAKKTNHSDNYNIIYRKGSAESIQSLDSSVALVCAGQCAHWFSLPKFYSEAFRVLMPGGALAVYGYLLPKPHYGDKPISHLVEKLMVEKLIDFMPEQSKSLYLGKYSAPEYKSFLFNNEPLVRDESMKVTLDSTVSDLVSYIASTSTMQNYLVHKGEQDSLRVLNDFQDNLMDTIGSKDDPDKIHLNVGFDFILIMGRKPF